jgi:hypothetical protein
MDCCLSGGMASPNIARYGFEFVRLEADAFWLGKTLWSGAPLLACSFLPMHAVTTTALLIRKFQGVSTPVSNK